MTEQANPSVVAHWLQLQQQYWEMWLNLAQQLTETSTTGEIPSRHSWREMLDLYWQTLEPSFAPDVRVIVRKFIDQGKNFSQFNNALLEAVQNAVNTEQPPPWLNTWQANFGDMSNNFSKFLTENDSPLNIWQLLHSNWWRMMMFTVPMSPVNFENIDGNFRENFEKLLTLPTLGYTREWQHKWQEGIKRWRAFQTAQQEYSGVLNKISLRSIELLREKASTFTENSETATEPPKTMRSIYDLWVECGEQAYGECVRTEEYIQAHANVINSLMACKYYEQEMTDELLGALNMPTRKELDTFSLRMQQMRRELKILQAKQVTNEIDVLTCQVNVLRAELETLKNAAKSTPAPTVTPTKTVAAPKTPTPHKTSSKRAKKTTTTNTPPIPAASVTDISSPVPTPADADKQGK